jgi:hypothetical protein
LRFFTVTCHGHAFAVVRAPHKGEAIDLARQMILPNAGFGFLPGHAQFGAHEPSNSEMIDWLERGSDYLLLDGAGYVLANLVGFD